MCIRCNSERFVPRGLSCGTYALLSAVETTANVVLNMADVFVKYIVYTRNIHTKLISELVSILISTLPNEMFVWI